MSHRLGFVSAYVENFKGDTKLSFDRIAQATDGAISVLCDGANSSIRGGECAEICSTALCTELAKSRGKRFVPINEVYNNVDTLIKRSVSDSGCTALALDLGLNSVTISGCGDSTAEVYRLGFFGWKLLFRTVPQLIGGTNNPSQLMGCAAYSYPYSKEIFESGRYAILLMSDGLYNFTTSMDRLKSVTTLKSETPSKHDLAYLLTDLAQIAASNGADDDVSGVLAWARYSC